MTPGLVLDPLDPHTVERMDAICLDAMRPDPDLFVWEWAEQFRILSEEEPEPGPKSYDRTPCLRPIAEALSMKTPWEIVILYKGSQIGATDLAADWYGHTIHLAPSKIISIWPSVEFAQRKSKELIDPLIESTPVLRTKVAPARAKDAQNTILIKRFPRGRLIMTGANSALGMRSTSSPKIHLDELDSFAQSAGSGVSRKEGDPVRLAMRATQNFKGRRKVYIASTPLDEATSMTLRELRRADVVVDFALPCPHCGYMQILDFFKGMKWETRGDGDARTVHDVHYECEGCKGKIYNHHKDWMLPRFTQRERWNTGGKRAIAFCISALYSPVGWYSWDDAALEWTFAKGNPTEEKTFWNTKLGLAWNDPAEAPSWEPLYGRREHWKAGEVQPGVCFLTMGVDVQQDRLELEVKGWGRNGVSWSILYRVLPGDPMGDEVWNDLDALLATKYPTAAHDGELEIWCCAVDAGKYPERVYKWARRHQQPTFTSTGVLRIGEPHTVIAVRGRDEWVRTILTSHKVSAEERKRGLKIVGIGVSKLKKELYRSLRVLKLKEDDADPPGYRHYPISDEHSKGFFRALTSERLLVKVINGRPKEIWEETPGQRNEPLDLDNYNRGAAAALGMDRLLDSEWDEIEAQLPGSLVRGTTASEVPYVAPEPTAPVETSSQTPRPEPGPPPGIIVPTRGSRWAGRTRLGGGG